MKKFAWASLLGIGLSQGIYAQDIYPICSSPAADPDGDGWGWENNRSCLVYRPGLGDYPVCSSPASDPDGDGWGWERNQSCRVIRNEIVWINGHSYPLCQNQKSDPDGDGWGWENNQSCVARN